LRQGIWKVVIVFVAIALAVSVGWAVRPNSGPVTEEEAKQIAANAELVKQCKATCSYSFVGGADFHNASWVAAMKTGNKSQYFEGVPEGHSIFEVSWVFTEPEVSGGGRTVIIMVDANTGAIVGERFGAGLG